MLDTISIFHRHDPSPGEVFVHTRPAQAERDSSGRRVPVIGDKPRFGETEWHREQTGPRHGLTVKGEGDVESGPRHQKRGRPDQPYVLVANHAVRLVLGAPSAQRTPRTPLELLDEAYARGGFSCAEPPRRTKDLMRR